MVCNECETCWNYDYDEEFDEYYKRKLEEEAKGNGGEVE